MPQSPFLPNETDVSVMMSAKRDRFDTLRDDGWILSSDGHPVYLRKNNMPS